MLFFTAFFLFIHPRVTPAFFPVMVHSLYNPDNADNSRNGLYCSPRKTIFPWHDGQDGIGGRSSASGISPPFLMRCANQLICFCINTSRDRFPVQPARVIVPITPSFRISRLPAGHQSATTGVCRPECFFRLTINFLFSSVVMIPCQVAPVPSPHSLSGTFNVGSVIKEDAFFMAAINVPSVYGFGGEVASCTTFASCYPQNSPSWRDGNVSVPASSPVSASSFTGGSSSCFTK